MSDVSRDMMADLSSFKLSFKRAYANTSSSTPTIFCPSHDAPDGMKDNEGATEDDLADEVLHEYRLERMRIN